MSFFFALVILGWEWSVRRMRRQWTLTAIERELGPVQQHRNLQVDAYLNALDFHIRDTLFRESFFVLVVGIFLVMNRHFMEFWLVNIPVAAVMGFFITLLQFVAVSQGRKFRRQRLVLFSGVIGAAVLGALMFVGCYAFYTYAFQADAQEPNSLLRQSVMCGALGCGIGAIAGGVLGFCYGIVGAEWDR